MELNIGEYIRTDRGEILKITSSSDIEYIKKVFSQFGKQIVKHSPNIIDLIEVGDYVNGKIITQSEYNLFINSDFEQEYAKNIKTIVTKEQFKNVMYEV